MNGRTQDGTSFPMIYFRGDGIYFASSTLALPFMIYISDILKKIGRGPFEELTTLYREYARHVRLGEIANTKVKQKVFKEAYDHKLELTLIQTGLQSQKLKVVEKIVDGE